MEAPNIIAPSLAMCAKELRRLHLEHLRGISTMPDYELQSIAKGKTYKLKTTNGITAAICDLVKYYGGDANRINTAGRKIKKNGIEIYIPSATKRGTPDIDIVYKGRAIKVEVKNTYTKDKLSPDQVKRRAALEAAGAIYVVAADFPQFYCWWMEHIGQSIGVKNNIQ